MAHFYGTVKGGRGGASRLGHASTGLVTRAASHQGAVKTTLACIDGVDWATVELVPHNGAGVSRVLYHGTVNGCIS
jgi:hypothetical protein